MWPQITWPSTLGIQHWGSYLNNRLYCTRTMPQVDCQPKAFIMSWRISICCGERSFPFWLGESNSLRSLIKVFFCAPVNPERDSTSGASSPRSSSVEMLNKKDNKECNNCSNTFCIGFKLFIYWRNKRCGKFSCYILYCFIYYTLILIISPPVPTSLK